MTENTETPNTETRKPAAKKPAAKKSTTIQSTPDYQSLTAGGSRPAIYGAKIPAAITARHNYLFNFLEKTGLINVREISYFIGIRPDANKSARVSDFFKFHGKNKPAAIPNSDTLKSEKLSIAAAVKKYPLLAPVSKFTDAIIYLTVEYGTKKITLNFSYKY